MTEDVSVRDGTFLPAKGHADGRTIFFYKYFPTCCCYYRIRSFESSPKFYIYHDLAVCDLSLGSFSINDGNGNDSAINSEFDWLSVEK